MNQSASFTHQCIVNIVKSKQLLTAVAKDPGFSLSEEVQLSLLAKYRLSQPLPWLLRHLSSAQLLSMERIFIVERNQ